jgi:hypothetical protein
MSELLKFNTNGQWELTKSVNPAANPAPAGAAGPQPLKIGQHSNGKFKAYNWKLGRVHQQPEEFDTHEQAKAHYEGKGHTIQD